MQNMIYEELSKRGCKARVMSISHLEQLQHDIEGACGRDCISDKFKSFINRFFDFSIPESLPNAKTIIIVAVPSPRVRVIFNYNGKRVPLFIPPTYVHKINNFVPIIKQIKETIELHDYTAVKARLPEKLLAVRSGLGSYGRNNICYIDGMGSFVRLAAFFSDIPCQEDNWFDARQMSSCKKCFICAKKCPTGSISKEEVLVNAERCICYINEHKGEFPDWLELAWHNSIVGCILCQEACPENKNFADNVADLGEFSQEETDSLLGNKPLESLAAETKDKLEQLSMLGYYDCLSRNLKVLLDR